MSTATTVPRSKTGSLGNESVIAVYKTHQEAEEAVRKLERARISSRKLFGLLMGFGLFVFPVAGTLVVLGPLSGMIAGAIGGAGIGALVNALIALGMSKEQALKYQRPAPGRRVFVKCDRN